MVWRPTVAAARLALVALLAGAAGCGDTGPAPATSSAGTPPTRSASAGTPDVVLPSTAEAFRDARTFALAAGSARAVGTVVRGGREVRIELEGDAASTSQHVVVEQEGGGLADVLTVDDRHWLAGDLDFWRGRGESPEVARASAAGWHEVPGAQARRVAPWTLRTLLTDIFARADVGGLESDPVPVVPDEVGGREAWVLGRADGPRLWVAADGGGELLRLLVPGEEPTDLRFSDWGRVQPLGPPDPDRIAPG
jgi:hypothetical protein